MCEDIVVLRYLGSVVYVILSMYISRIKNVSNRVWS